MGQVNQLRRIIINLKPNHPLDMVSKEKVSNYHGLNSSLLRCLRTSDGYLGVEKLYNKIPKMAAEIDDTLKNGFTWTAQDKQILSPNYFDAMIAFPAMLEKTPKALADVKNALKVLKDSKKTYAEKKLATTKGFVSVTSTAKLYTRTGACLFPTIPAAPGLLVATSALTVAQTITSIEMDAENVLVASAIQFGNANKDIRKAVDETKVYNTLSLAQNITACISAILALQVMLTGAAIIPAVFILSLTILALVLGLVASVYKEMMEYQPIDFISCQTVL